MSEDFLSIIKDKGLLLEKDVFDLLNRFNNKGDAKRFLEQMQKISGQRMITTKTLVSNVDYMKSFVTTLNEDDKGNVEKVFVKLGFNLKVVKEKTSIGPADEARANNTSYKIYYAQTTPDKKLEVKDFVGNFRARFHQIQKILMNRVELQQNLVSIGKIGNDRSLVSLIGIVVEKNVTKNKNLMIRIEDLTGEIKMLIKFDNKELLEKAEELQLDDIIGVRASGSRDFLFAHEIFFPDAFIQQKAKFDEEGYIAFISDIHCGSDRHLSQSFSNFLNWLNSEHEVAKKMKYIFIVGDTVDGVGIFPGQEDVLTLKSMNEQYKQLASYLEKVPKNITMFMCPGQHDATRVAEPQPVISKKYAPEIYEIDNLVLVTNPTMVKLSEEEKEFKILMYHGASIHNFINEIKELREMKAHKCPAKAIKHMLKRRHLSPTHSEAIYIPNAEVDPLVISEVPDILCTGEVHRLDVENYNGVLIITGSCWQARTPFEEKIGNEPDPAKVPVFNLKTRELKIFDFGVAEEINKNYNEK